MAQPLAADQCAVVVASRPTLAEAQDYRASHPNYRIAEIYLSENGWYALIQDHITRDDAAGILKRRKSGKLIPGDSYCSSGRSFVRRVWPADTPPPIVPSDTALFSEFDARYLGSSEKRFLQAALALTGDYDGRLDGKWGQNSQAALERWSQRHYQVLPANFHAALLAGAGSEMLEQQGWRAFTIPGQGISLQVPFALMHSEEAEPGSFKLVANDGRLSAIVSAGSVAEAAGLHESLVALAREAGQSTPYLVRRDDFWVTSFARGDYWVYERSDFSGRTARTALFVATGETGHRTASLLIASYQPGRQPDLELPVDGALMGYLADIPDAPGQADDQRVGRPPLPSADASVTTAAPASPEPRASGSGFYINSSGTVMTNAHVVDGCRRLTVDGHDGEVGAVDGAFDLAVIELASGIPYSAKPLAFATKPARLNADVTVAGFPLNGLLDTLNVTRGSISALKGMDNDATRLQITAPVQSGNSGGPIVDRYGQVVGVVVSKMNGLVVADATGDLPQNVNFGVRGSIARIFAEANGIEIQQSDMSDVLLPEDVAERLSKATVLVECY